MRACVRLGCVGDGRGADEVQARAKRMPEYCAQCSPLGLVRPTVCGVLGVLLVVPDWVLLRFPMWSEPSPILSVRALCAVVRV